MAQLTPTGLVKIMGLVTLIMVVPMVGGAVAGLVLDKLLGTLADRLEVDPRIMSI